MGQPTHIIKSISVPNIEQWYNERHAVTQRGNHIYISDARSLTATIHAALTETCDKVIVAVPQKLFYEAKDIIASSSHEGGEVRLIGYGSIKRAEHECVFVQSFDVYPKSL